MSDKLTEIKEGIIEFKGKHKFDVQFYEHSVRELTCGDEGQNQKWARFETHAGVYCFFSKQENKIKYIGMSHQDTGNRLVGWLYKENKIRNGINDEDIILHAVLKNEPYMASALEYFLIKNFKTTYNVINKKIYK